LLFISSHPQEKFKTKRQKITEQIDETELDIGFSFMTEEDMKNANFPQPHVWKENT